MKAIRSHIGLHPIGLCVVLFLISTQSWGQEGFCTNGDCENGHGTYLFADKSTYVGQFRDGKQHGYGTFYSNGGKYVGEWRDNLTIGQGTLTFADGSTSSGRWVNGEFQENIDIPGLQAKKNNCTNYGFTPGSDAHSQCVMQLAIAEKSQAASSADAARTQAAIRAQQAAIRAQQAAQDAALQEAEDYARRQREAEILMRMGGSISRGCGAFGC
jgi:hypothetical protein